MASAELREHIEGLLRERSVMGVPELVERIGETGLHGALAIIKRYDVDGHDSPGLLVYMLKHTDLAAYRDPKDRTAATSPGELAGAEITPALIASVKRGCECPDGITREEAEGMYAEAANRRGLAAGALITAAMGARWQGTPKTTVYQP